MDTGTGCGKDGEDSVAGLELNSWMSCILVRGGKIYRKSNLRRHINHKLSSDEIFIKRAFLKRF